LTGPLAYIPGWALIGVTGAVIALLPALARRLRHAARRRTR
jgi:hypothetical protein